MEVFALKARLKMKRDAGPTENLGVSFVTEIRFNVHLNFGLVYAIVKIIIRLINFNRLKCFVEGALSVAAAAPCAVLTRLGCGTGSK